MKDLRALLNSLEPEADLAQRHVWLIELFEWLRGNERSTQACAARLQTFIMAVQAQPGVEARLRAWWQKLVETVEVTTLLADFGFAPRTAFLSELAERLRRKLLPGTPETIDTSELFPLVAPSRFDAQWMAALPEEHVRQIPIRTCRIVQEQQQRVVRYCTTHTVQEQHVRYVNRTVCRMEPTQETRMVPTTVCEMQAYTVCRPVTRCVPVCVPCCE